MSSEVYSFHTFIFPFSLNELDYGRSEGFVNHFEKNKNWTSADVKSHDAVKMSRELYKEYQYFYVAARKSIYGLGEGIVHNYSFMNDVVSQKAHYIISKTRKGESGVKKTEYDLSVDDIKLKIFNTGIALLILECKNTKYGEIGDMKDINDYGRRIVQPFITGKDGIHDSLTADMLKLHVDDNIEFISDFTEECGGYGDSSYSYIGGFINELINYGANDKVSILPIMGDRMYVMSIIGNTALEIGVEEKIIDYNHFSNSLYELVFVDPNGKCSCADDDTRDELLKEASYKRWHGEGSLYYITNYSFILGVDKLIKNVPDFVTESFRTHYLQMFCLAIAQRASVFRFKDYVAYIAGFFGKKADKQTTDNYMYMLSDVTERYIAFESQLYFDEISPEQQGIEMYDLMKARLRIKEEVDSLKEQIDGLNNLANIKSDNRANNTMSALTWIAFWVSMASLIISSLQITEFKEMYCGTGAFYVVAVALCVSVAASIVHLYMSYKKNKRNL
ncbi:MAG: hypothetical protein K6G72_08935 [Lachnospiraceae bacterium]|nr:hypothetical protein [Lachnospiraceae bacterium]